VVQTMRNIQPSIPQALARAVFIAADVGGFGRMSPQAEFMAGASAGRRGPIPDRDDRAKRMGRGDDIGNAATAMAERMQFGVPQANGSVEVEPTIDPQQVARAVVYMASLPLDANVLFLTVMATRMPFVGRG